MSLLKLRKISYFKKKPVFGFTVPDEIATFFLGTYFNCARSGNCIVFESGAKSQITEQQLTDYKFEDVRI